MITRDRISAGCPTLAARTVHSCHGNGSKGEKMYAATHIKKFVLIVLLQRLSSPFLLDNPERDGGGQRTWGRSGRYKSASTAVHLRLLGFYDCGKEQNLAG